MEFEIRWNAILQEYGLAENEWFQTIFNLLEFWIPAYFKDVTMAGLFRTTSMSESENSFFRRYNNKNANLLHFMMHYDSAIDAQREKYNKLVSIDESSIPLPRTDCLFEKHAASIYSSNIFQKVRKDMKACSTSCGIVTITRGPNMTTFDIDDSCVDLHFKVEANLDDESFVCECKHFSKHRLLCRHIYAVMKNMRLFRIPEKYIVPRWTKYAGLKDIVKSADDVIGRKDEKFAILNQLRHAASKCIRTVAGDVHRMKKLLEDFNEMTNKHNMECSFVVTDEKQMTFDSFYGSSLPDQVSMFPPDNVKTKGSGSRLKSRKEKAIREANRPKRKCGKCKQMGHHDARNCDKAV